MWTALVDLQFSTCSARGVCRLSTHELNGLSDKSANNDVEFYTAFETLHHDVQALWEFRDAVGLQAPKDMKDVCTAAVDFVEKTEKAILERSTAVVRRISVVLMEALPYASIEQEYLPWTVSDPEEAKITELDIHVTRRRKMM